MNKVILFRCLSVLPLGIALMIASDLFLGPAHSDLAEVTGLSADGTVHAHGRYDYKEPVPEHLAALLKTGDKLELSLTRFFYEWDEAKLVRDGTVVDSARGEDLVGMGFAGLVLLTSLLVFLPTQTLSSRPPLLRFLGGWVVLLAIPAGVLWAVELLMWMGFTQPPPGG